VTDKEAVTVKILDREYRIACEADERRQLLDAADYLDQQMRQLKEGMNLPGSEKVAVLAALNIANDLLAARNVEQQYSGDVASRIHSLREKLDQNIQGQD
jgi:cell division protein ZapA